jgi:hypothetical protein
LALRERLYAVVEGMSVPARWVAPPLPLPAAFLLCDRGLGLGGTSIAAGGTPVDIIRHGPRFLLLRHGLRLGLLLGQLTRTHH